MAKTDQRDIRLAAALRENLKRRKTQDRTLRDTNVPQREGED